jgi:hypothetical protein
VKRAHLHDAGAAAYSTAFPKSSGEVMCARSWRDEPPRAAATRRSRRGGAAGSDKELGATLIDIKTMAYLGKYYAHKIDGSTNLALFRQIKDKKYQEEAVNQLTMALEFWEKYTQTAMQQNINPLWTNRVGHVDWVKINEWVKRDIEIAKVAVD